MKLTIITCYKHPDYVRAKTLRAAASSLDNVEVIVVKNIQRGVLRYPEVLWRVLWVRLRLRPDVYLVTFRGYEIFPFVRVLSVGKTMWYDEFINPIEWAMLEHKKLPDWRVFRLVYRWLVNLTQKVLADTESHADFSAQITGVDRSKILVVPVASDDNSSLKPVAISDEFRVFFYGTMLPLHGFSTILEAAIRLASYPITFHFVGGGEAVKRAIDQSKKAGATIRYDPWLDYDELMEQAASASLCLGGPFGATVQSQFVIGGKVYQFMQMGKPVVVGKNKESHIFTDKKDALIVDPANPQQLADTIIWAYDHQAKLADIGKAAQQLYEAKLSVAVVANRLRPLFATVTKKR